MWFDSKRLHLIHIVVCQASGTSPSDIRGTMTNNLLWFGTGYYTSAVLTLTNLLRTPTPYVNLDFLTWTTVGSKPKHTAPEITIFSNNFPIIFLFVSVIPISKQKEITLWPMSSPSPRSYSRLFDQNVKFKVTYWYKSGSLEISRVILSENWIGFEVFMFVTARWINSHQ